MKISLSWLKYYVDIDVPVEELCDKMTMAGFEIEEIIDLKETMVNVVAAKILKIEEHPDSDHLLICQMDVGAEEPLQIVTGASNVFVGATVPAALHNSHLPNGMNIKNGKLRGIASNGMLCSGEELELKESDYPGAEVNGILILKDGITPGTDMREVLGLDDYIIDFKITANRPDCQSVLGVAREVAVVLEKEFKLPKPQYETIGGDINEHIKISNLNLDLCPRYYGRVVNNLKIEESPEWLKRCVKAAGMRPINNIVDITNFVMLETGQPMHAFDKRDIKGDEIIVRNAADGEKITTLDGKEHTLTSEMLVIADKENPSCLAGVMGGLNSEIKDDTTNLFLECAKFRRDNVRRTTRALGMRTESSARFEKGVDTNNVEYAMNRALQLIYDLKAGEIIDGAIDLNSGLPADRELNVTVDSVNALLGLNIPGETMEDILNRLCIKTTLKDGVLNCLVPSFRDDIEGRADIAEEVMRIYGYDHIVGTSMKGAITRGRILPERSANNKIKALLSSYGMREITTYSFIGKNATDMLGLAGDDKRRNAMTILNPLSEEYSVMRTQLTTSMLTVLATNYNRKIIEAKLYEFGKIYVPYELPVTRQPDEIPTLSLGSFGKNEDFFSMKGALEDIYASFGMKVSYEASNEPYLHPGRQANIIFNGEVIGVFGELHPKTAEKFDIETKAYIGEISLRPIYNYERPTPVFKVLPKFPSVTRDLAIICDATTPVGKLEEAIKTASGKLCEELNLFDVYMGKQIPEGKKSVAYSLVLRSAESTLTDEDVEKVMRKVFKLLENCGAALRQ